MQIFHSHNETVSIFLLVLYKNDKGEADKSRNHGSEKMKKNCKKIIDEGTI